VRRQRKSHPLQTRLIGQYNVSNLLGVLAAMRAMGVPLAAAVQACGGLLPVPGRMERIALDGQPLVAVDYAHTPDALDKALRPCVRWPASAAGSCGACLAAAAIVIPPSVR
jgi:UDP-N-acetylmuramyl tripeptide synthase